MHGLEENKWEDRQINNQGKKAGVASYKLIYKISNLLQNAAFRYTYLYFEVFNTVVASNVTSSSIRD